MLSWAPPIVLVGFNAVAYGVYMAVDGLEHVNSWQTSKSALPTSFVVFHVSFMLMWISYIRLMLNPPGSVPDDNIWICSEPNRNDDEATRFALAEDELELMAKVVEHDFYPFTEPLRDRIRRLPFVELKRHSVSIRRCMRCNPAHFKPDRTHHCSKTDTCVLVMDHYCNFAHTTVGLHNRKFFVLFLLYALTSLVMYLAIMSKHLEAALDHLTEGIVFLLDAIVVLLCLVGITLIAGLALFLSFHIYIILHCMTTIEFREKRQSLDQEVRRRSAIANVKFNHGYWANLVDVFGSIILVWPLPIRARAVDPYDGLGIEPSRLVSLSRKQSSMTLLP